MTKTIKLCDICGKQFSSEEKYKGGVEGVDVKAKIDGQRFDMSFEECHGKLVNTTIDMCDDCYSKYRESVKLIVSRDENGQYTHYRIEDFVKTPIGFEEESERVLYSLRCHINDEEDCTGCIESKNSTECLKNLMKQAAHIIQQARYVLFGK